METRSLLTLAAGVAAGYWGWRRFGRDTIEGRSVLITGGSRGLGLVLAREFARRGAKVAICARDEDELVHARHRLEGGGAVVISRVCDVSSEEQVNELVRYVEREFGRLDILVNNAGVIQVGPLENLDLEDFEEAMDTMFWGVLYPTRAALAGMLERRDGRIVNITSIGGKVSVPHLLPYCSAKFAAVGFSEGLRAELAGTGVDVTTIAPGLMRTGSYYNAEFKGKRDEEFTWFSLGSSLPGITMSAERAAKQIVRATDRRAAEQVLSAPAKLLSWFHGLWPGLTARLMGGVRQLMLPSANGMSDQGQSGGEVHDELEGRSRSVLDALTTLGRRAAREYQDRP